MQIDLSKPASGFTVAEQEAIYSAGERIAQHRLKSRVKIFNPDRFSVHLKPLMRGKTREEFGVIYLDGQNHVIDTHTLFTGTIDSAAVYPRVVVETALKLGASAIAVYHNHPSGNPEPSQSDRAITLRLRDALALVEIRLLDHLVIGATSFVSLAQRGWI